MVPRTEASSSASAASTSIPPFAALRRRSSPQSGTHLFWYRGRPFWVSLQARRRSKDCARRGAAKPSRSTRSAASRISSAPSSAEIVACHHQQDRASLLALRLQRLLDNASKLTRRVCSTSVILPPGEKELVVEDLARFRCCTRTLPPSRRSIPPRLSLLRSARNRQDLVRLRARRAEFGMSIYLLNLTEFDDRSLKSAMNDVPENSVILFEDIDCMKAGNRRSE